MELLKDRKDVWDVCNKKGGNCYKTGVAVSVVARLHRAL